MEMVATALRMFPLVPTFGLDITFHAPQLDVELIEIIPDLGETLRCVPDARVTKRAEPKSVN